MQRTEDFRVTIKAFDEDSKMWIALVNTFQDILNKHLRIKDYGEVLNDILIIYVAHGMSEILHPNFITYSRKYKEIIIQYRLKQENMPKQTEKENLQALAHAYLDAIKQSKTKNRVKGFDFVALLIDLEKAFEAEGWLLKLPLTPQA